MRSEVLRHPIPMLRVNCTTITITRRPTVIRGRIQLKVGLEEIHNKLERHSNNQGSPCHTECQLPPLLPELLRVRERIPSRPILCCPQRQLMQLPMNKARQIQHTPRTRAVLPVPMQHNVVHLPYSPEDSSSGDMVRRGQFLLRICTERRQPRHCNLVPLCTCH